MWAPDVAQLGEHDMLSFTSQLPGVSPSTMCIGDAITTSVAGPYLASLRVAAPTPVVRQQSLGASIDPRLFVDGTRQPYMVWKSDQNARPGFSATQIYSQPLSTRPCISSANQRILARARVPAPGRASDQPVCSIPCV